MSFTYICIHNLYLPIIELVDVHFLHLEYGAVERATAAHEHSRVRACVGSVRRPWVSGWVGEGGGGHLLQRGGAAALVVQRRLQPLPAPPVTMRAHAQTCTHSRTHGNEGGRWGGWKE
jgi:hypothetical protein